MEPQFQTSFIPKKPVSSGIKIAAVPGPISIISVISSVVLVVTIIAAGGVFAYKYWLESQIAGEEKSMAAAEESLQPNTIKEMVVTSGQIAFTQELLNSHLITSRIFDLLQSLTLKKIYFTDFSYVKQDGNYSISMNGESQGYNALTQQYNIFNQSGMIKNSSFSDFSLSKDGNISFKFSGILDPLLISYKNFVEKQQ